MRFLAQIIFLATLASLPLFYSSARALTLQEYLEDCSKQITALQTLAEREADGYKKSDLYLQAHEKEAECVIKGNRMAVSDEDFKIVPPLGRLGVNFFKYCTIGVTQREKDIEPVQNPVRREVMFDELMTFTFQCLKATVSDLFDPSIAFPLGGKSELHETYNFVHNCKVIIDLKNEEIQKIVDPMGRFYALPDLVSFTWQCLLSSQSDLFDPSIVPRLGSDELGETSNIVNNCRSIINDLKFGYDALTCGTEAHNKRGEIIKKIKQVKSWCEGYLKSDLNVPGLVDDFNAEKPFDFIEEFCHYPVCGLTPDNCEQKEEPRQTVMLGESSEYFRDGRWTPKACDAIFARLPSYTVQKDEQGVDTRPFWVPSYDTGGANISLLGCYQAINFVDENQIDARVVIDGVNIYREYDPTQDPLSKARDYEGQTNKQRFQELQERTQGKKIYQTTNVLGGSGFVSTYETALDSDVLFYGKTPEAGMNAGFLVDNCFVEYNGQSRAMNYSGNPLADDFHFYNDDGKIVNLHPEFDHGISFLHEKAVALASELADAVRPFCGEYGKVNGITAGSARQSVSKARINANNTTYVPALIDKPSSQNFFSDIVASNDLTPVFKINIASPQARIPSIAIQSPQNNIPQISIQMDTQAPLFNFTIGGATYSYGDRTQVNVADNERASQELQNAMAKILSSDWNLSTKPVTISVPPPMDNSPISAGNAILLKKIITIDNDSDSNNLINASESSLLLTPYNGQKAEATFRQNPSGGAVVELESGAFIVVVAGTPSDTIKVPIDLAFSMGNIEVRHTKTSFGLAFDPLSGKKVIELYDGEIEISDWINKKKLATLTNSFGSPIKRVEIDAAGNITEKTAIPQLEWADFVLKSQQKEASFFSAWWWIPFIVVIGGVGYLAYRKKDTIMKIIKKEPKL